MDGKADSSCIVLFTTRRKMSLFVLHMTHDQSCINQWSGQVLRGESRVQRRWEGSVMWDIKELERLRISDLSVLVCFG